MYPYGDNNYIGMAKGTYTLTGVTSAHPIGFVINDTTKLEVISGTCSWYSKTKVNSYGESINTDYYTCDSSNIVIDVKGDFGKISYDCYNHGYMGGQNRLMYYREVVLEFKTEFKEASEIGSLST